MQRPLPRVKSKPWPLLKMTNFYGGLNQRDSSTELSDNEAQDLLNVDFAKAGGLLKRSGTNIVGDDKGNNKVLGIHSAYYGSGSAKMLMANQDAATSGLWYRTTGNWTEATLSGGNKLANADAEFESFLNNAGNQVVFVVDGTRYQYYNPSDNKIYAATASPATIGSIIRVYGNRMYSVGNSTKPERVYFSALGNGGSWGVNDYFDVPSQAVTETGAVGDPIMALASFQNRLIILKARSVWQYDTKQLRLLSNSVGCVGKRAFAVTDTSLYFADNDGVYRLSGSSILKVSKKIQPVWNLIPAARIPELAMGAHENRVYVATATTGATANNIILVNYTDLPQDQEGQQPWSYWKGTASNPLAATCFTTYEATTTTLPILCYGHASQGAAVQLNTGNADYEFTGAAQNESIDGYYQTKDFPLSARFRKLFVATKAQASSYDLNVSALVDFKTTRHMTYDMYDATADAVVNKDYVNQYGKYINYKFATSASSAQPFTILDAKQEVKPLKLR
jgi:hypothetical protein